MRSGYLMVEETPGIDHQMYRSWCRSVIVGQMERFLASLPSARTTGRE
jgi:hypothetical protein